MGLCQKLSICGALNLSDQISMSCLRLLYGCHDFSLFEDLETEAFFFFVEVLNGRVDSALFLVAGRLLALLESMIPVLDTRNSLVIFLSLSLKVTCLIFLDY